MRDGDKFYIHLPEIIPINRDEHSTEAVCEERAGTASLAVDLRAKGCVIFCSINCEKPRGDVKRDGVQ